MSVTLTGDVGSLRWGYHIAASLRAWTILRTESGTVQLTATFVTQDAIRLSQQPLVFVASHPKGTWRWPILALQIMGGSLTASLGPKES